jgi:hypothetical protein
MRAITGKRPRSRATDLEVALSQSSIGITSRHWPARMRRKQASEYLLEVHGVSLSTATLAKLAVIGGGPAYRKDGPFPIYDQPVLDDYAVARLGPLRASTSESLAA